MKVSTLKAEITVPVIPKTLALILALLEPIYYGDRAKIIKMLVRYYEVTL
jgi:hypothetical protein